MGHPVDAHVGARIRQRRWMLGMTQQALADRLGVTFQQVQKYEMGSNRVSASRLWSIARLLGVSVEFFFEGLRTTAESGTAVPEADALTPLADGRPLERDAAQLLRSFCAIPAERRRRLLDLARALSDPAV